MTELTGGCLCGSVRFKCKSGPIASYACHCRFCQRSLGTAYRAAMSFNHDDVVVYAKHRMNEDGSPADPI